MDTDDNLRKRDGGHNTVVDSFKKVTRAEKTGQRQKKEVWRVGRGWRRSK